MLIIKNSKGFLEKSNTHYIKSNHSNFKDWYCDAGKDSLWIYFNGDIFGNACRSIRYGNVYESFDILDTPIVCPLTSCFCGADISITKARTLKDLEDIKSLDNSIDFKNLKSLETDDIVSIIHTRNLKYKNTFTIDWNVGKRCNFDCSYCPSTVHNNHSPHLTLEKFIPAFDKIYSTLKEYQTIDIVFTGGEPTINPEYIDIASYAKRSNTCIFTNTNCTANIDKLEKLMHLGGLYISIHEEFTEKEKILKKIKTLYDRMENNDILSIKYMLVPNNLSETKKFITMVPSKKNNFFISIHPLVDKINNGKRLDYSLEELKFISTYELI